MSLNLHASQEVRELVAGFRRAQHAVQRGLHQEALLSGPGPLFTPRELAILAVFSGLLSAFAVLI
jgi:hypothetical protein